mgnify:CR=1 FL=1
MNSLRQKTNPRLATAMPQRLGARRQRGVILVLALWLIVVLSLIAYSLAYEMQIETMLTSQRRDSTRALEVARLGVARAIADLKNDAVMDHVADLHNPGIISPFDGPGDLWRETQDYTDVKAAKDAIYTVRISDEESKLPLNMANLNQLEVFKDLLRVLGESDRDAEDIGCAVFDWIDPDDIPVGQQGESELTYYSEIIAHDERLRWDANDPALIHPLNDNFVAVEQLLTVPGMTPELYYGYDPNDEHEVSRREELLAHGRAVKPGLRDCVTVVSSGQLNVNTARPEVLAAIFARAAGGSVEQGKQMADKLRSAIGATSKKPNNDKAPRTMQELAQVLGSEGQLILTQAGSIQPLSVRSSTFLITAEGTILDSKREPKVTRRAEAMVSRSFESFTLNDQKDSLRERRYNRDEFNQRIDRMRKSGKNEGGIGAIQVPLVRCYWWTQS